MELNTIKEAIKDLSKTDFVRLYLHINQEFDNMKSNNPKNVLQLVYNARNPEKVKQNIYKYRAKKRTEQCDK